MPLKTLKRETAESLILEWILHVKNYRLTLNKNFCVGCEICSLACPKEAIKLEKLPKTPDGKARHAKVDINLEKCNFCGICDIMCPFGAIKMTINGEHILNVLEKGSFPQLTRDIQVNSAKCTLECVDCEEGCPLDLIKISYIKPDGKVVEDLKSLTTLEREWLRINVNIDKERCPCCRICEFKCPEGLIHVRKIFHGRIKINQEKCPEGCKDCLDVCPITGALYLSEADKKVHVNELFCVYCGACKVICPIDGAMELKRTGIMHTPVRSGAWNKALERLTSSLETSKELKAKSSQKAVEAVERRLKWKEVVV